MHAKMHVIRKLGNSAVHSSRPVQPADARAAARAVPCSVLAGAALWPQVGARPDPALQFRADRCPGRCARQRRNPDELQKLAQDLAERDAAVAAGRQGRCAGRRTGAPARRGGRGQEGQTTPSPTPTTTTRRRPATFIDLLLKEAGWPLDQARDREFEVTGMPNNQGKGFVDYVLWGDDGKPLAVVEAKRTERDARVGQQQAKLYADCLERQFGQRPVIFYSNGYEHWLWDDASYPPRAVQGFYKKAELELLIQRRSSRKPLAARPIDGAIVERYYQTRAIRRIAEAFEQRPATQGAAGDGDRRGQDPHGDRAVRPADALQLGEARAVPGRPRGAGEPGGERLQGAPAGCRAGEPGDREGRRGAGLRLHLSDDDGADRRDAATGSAASASGHFDL